MSDTTNDETWVMVGTFPEPMEANMARSALEAAGIEVNLRGEMANSMVPIAFTAQLQVRRQDEAAARQVLDSGPESLESVTAAEIADEGR